ncbi:MAG TPA: tetratricopeptide repeat protein [Candidatus Kapabacteria bacterium]|nr:tetratricopeptide repeat protein [Candidatus Kapabacteria bacterium]
MYLLRFPLGSLVPALLACCMATVATLHAQPRKAIPPTAAQEELIGQGSRAHDSGDYSRAISLYRQVLNQNPDVVMAIYEMSFTFFESKQFDSAVAYARRGLEYASDQEPLLYVTLGSSYDAQGKGEKAIETYSAGLKKHPSFALLHFNLGVTYFSRREGALALASFKQALRLEPNHPGSHFWLGQTYQALGYRIPAALAFCRFLMLEPATRRSEVAVHTIHEIIGSLVSVGGEAKNEIVLRPSDSLHLEEGDFRGLELKLGMLIGTSRSMGLSKEDEPITWLDISQLVDGCGDSVIAAGHGFAAAYYAPYFAQLEQHGFSEAFSKYVLISMNDSNTVAWLKEHEEDVRSMFRWSAAYMWPR